MSTARTSQPVAPADVDSDDARVAAEHHRDTLRKLHTLPRNSLWDAIGWALWNMRGNL